ALPEPAMAPVVLIEALPPGDPPVIVGVAIVAVLIVGDVKVLLVKVSVPARVASVPEAGKVTAEPAAWPLSVTTPVSTVRSFLRLRARAPLSTLTVSVRLADKVVPDVAASVTLKAADVSRSEKPVS